MVGDRAIWHVLPLELRPNATCRADDGREVIAATTARRRGLLVICIAAACSVFC